MSPLRRPDPRALVVDLTQRLSEEFHVVPMGNVRSAVQSAVAATRLFGNDLAASLDTIEQLAREDLNAVRAATLEQNAAALAG